MLGKVLSTWQTIKGAVASAFIGRITIFMYVGSGKNGNRVAGNHHGLDGANCSDATSNTCAVFSLCWRKSSLRTSHSPSYQCEAGVTAPISLMRTALRGFYDVSLACDQ